MKSSLLTLKLILLLTLCTTLGKSQVSVSGSIDNPAPHGYCDIITFTMNIGNGGATSTFTGRITYNIHDFTLVDYSELPNAYIEVASSDYNHLFFSTDEPIENLQTESFEYKMIIKPYTPNAWLTVNKATRNSDGVHNQTNIEVYPYSDEINPIPYPNYGHIYASEILEDYENNGTIVLFPLEPDENSDVYACNEELSQFLYIEDELIFDIPYYCIYNGEKIDDIPIGEIIVGSGGQIRIQNGASLYVNGQTIRSCQEMWKGFYVETGGSLYLIDCNIVNAQYGIEAERGATVTSVRTLFQDNYIGFYVSPFSAPYDPEHPENYYVDSKLHSNLFIGSGSMLPPYEGQTPTPNDIPYAGISVSNLTAFILQGSTGGTSTSANAFENLSNGIIAIRTALYTGDEYFKDINRNPSFLSPIQGYGIYINNSQLGQYSELLGDNDGHFGPYSYHFNNCDISVYNRGGGINVYGMTMNSVNEGIHIENVKNRNIFIEENNIHGSEKGILLNHCIPRQNYIRNNNLDVTGIGDITSGIEMNDYPTPSHWNVEQNYLTLGDGVFGIGNKAGYRINIMNNTVYKNHYDEDDAHGISLEGTKFGIVTCNALYGDMVDEELHETSGIYSTGGNNFNISCNEISDFQYGIYLAGDHSSQNLLRGNTFGYEWVGLLLNENATIGPQFHYGNIWNDSYIESGAKHLGDAIIVGLSPFKYDKGDNEFYEPPNIQAATTWFTRVTGNSFLCEPENVCPDGIGYTTFSPVWTSLDQDLVAGNLGFTDFNNSLSWMGRFHTFHRLKNVPSISLPSDITTFISNQRNLNIGKFSNSLDSMTNALRYTGTFESGIDAWPIFDSSHVRKILYLDSLLYVDGPNNTISNLIKLHYDSIFYNEYSFHFKDSIINLKIETKVNNAIDYIENITPDSIWQESLQFSLLEALHFAKTDTLLSSTDVYNLALSCPDEYGDAVYHARSLVRVDSTLNKYDDYSLCGGLVSRSAEEINQPIGILCPNPTSSFFEIRTKEPISGYFIFNNNGALIYSESSLIENLLNVNTTSYTSGLYLIKVVYSDGRFEIYKFLVIH